MTKIVHLTTVHPPFDTRIFYKECKTLSRAGYDVTLIVQHNRNEMVDGIKLISLPKPKNRFQRIVSLTWKAYKLSKNETAAIYHFHDPELLPVGLLLKLCTKGMVIYDVHEDVPEQILTKFWIPQWMRGIISKAFNIIEKNSAKCLDAAIVATEGIGEKFKKNHHLVIHNYPDLDMLPKPKEIETGNQRNNVIYIGGITKHRGAFEMIRALGKVEISSDIHLTLIGPISPEKLDLELQALPGYHSVTWYDRLPWADAWNIARKMDLGLVLIHPIPRYMVALPTKLYEYMMCGLPVVASNFPLWKEIVEGNKCGICVNPLDIDEIAGAVQYILTHPEEARIMGENGRRAVHEKYNWDIEGAKLCLLYKSLINTPCSNPLSMNR